MMDDGLKDDGMKDEWEFVDVKVEALTLSPQGFALLLRPPDEDRVLPIFIGVPEAQSIAQALEGETFPRPLTHDLFRMALETLGAEVVRVQIVHVEEQTFHASLVLLAGGDEIELDARPSDAISLALRFDAPIQVRQDIWDSTSTPFEVEGKHGDGTSNARELLEKRLKRAIETEHYEEAARLRDELKRLGGGN